MDELAFLSATEQAGLVRRGEVSPLELVELYLERIERLDPELNAFVTVCADEARAAAAGDLPDGPFRGVPLPIKDLHETAGIRTTYSSRAYADYVPDFDSAVVRRLKEAGFVVIGKTNTPELGITAVTESELNGACRNPWDLSRTPGGSSGGAAAAVAAGLSPAAQGSDGGGSIRIPCSCCGLFGIKPARGRVSSAPYGGLEGFSTSGPITRTVLDAAAMLDAMAGYEPGDPWWAPPPERPFAEEVGRDPGRLRIAMSTVPPLEAPVAAECLAAVEDAAALLSGLGHSVEEANPPWGGDLFHLFMQVWQVGPALQPRPPELFEPMNRALIESAAATNAVDYVRATAQLRSISRQIVAFLEPYDLLLTPTLAQLPPAIGSVIVEDDPWESFRRAGRFTAFTQAANITGQPAVSVPLTWTGAGLPVGIQLVGRPAGEATLVRVSAQLEAARPWAGGRPPVS